MGFGLCTLAALMWLLWWNGFGEIHEDQLSLRYFREILSFLVLGQLTGVIGILREKWLARAIRNPRWVELGLGLVILVMLAGDFFHSTFISKIELQNIFRALCLCYGAAPLLNLKEYFFRIARRNRGFHLPRIRPALLFLLTLIAFIALGGTLLMSPGATKDGIVLSATDAYFISTSAVCVTGLVPLNVHEHFTNYGQTILLVLFQVGAFGIMTFTYFVSLMVGQGLSLRSKVTISNLLDEEGIAQVDRFIKNIIAVTFGVEALGAIGLYFSWRHVPGLEGDTLWWYAVFHSVSGFCNAGFSLFADNLATPGVAYNMGGQIIIMVMVLCGSLGFAMYLEIVRRARVALGWDARNTVSRHWSTYSWLVVRMTAALVLGGCGKEKVPESEFATADEAKEALTSAETIEIYFDLYGSKRKTKIVADGKVAGYLQKNTVYINEEEWFSIDYVEDEPINDREGSGTTYGYYDASGTCLGYAQEQYVDTSYGKDTRLIFLDVDETPLDYQSSRSGRILYDENDEEIGSGKIGRSGVSLLDQWYTNLYCAVFKTETDGTRQIDFMDRMAMLWRLERDYRSIDDNPVNTGVQIYETVAVVFILIMLIGSSFSKWRQKKKD